MTVPLAPADVAAAAQLACLLEASAPKPGNVSPGLHFHDTRYEDFLASAAAIGPAFAQAGERPLGATILDAVAATARWTQANTNLGIVLLLAPIARAARSQEPGDLRARVAHVLRSTTVDDAADAYAAIRLARPGGLGTASSEDVAGAPTVTLRDAMALAAQRDAVAREYATDFALVFDTGAPALRHARALGLDWADATVETYLSLLAATPDTLIARKLGTAASDEVSVQALAALDAGATRTSEGRAMIRALDESLRDPRNRRNPGTTADLTCAALFAVILEGGWTEGERRVE